MKKIGMLVAIEMDSVLSRYGDPSEKLQYPGYTVLTYKNDDYTIYALRSGAGEIAAASGTQFLISVMQVDMILNFGVVGGLTPEMATSKTCVVESVVHYDLETKAWTGLEQGRYEEYPSVYIPTTPDLVKCAVSIHPDLKTVICASADKFVDDADQKEKLHLQFGAHICDMESAGVVLTCNRNKIPCLLIKAVSDGLTGGAGEFLTELERVSCICLEIADKIIRGL